MQLAPTLGILILIPRQVVTHSPGSLSTLLRSPPPPQGADVSSLKHLRTSLWQGGSSSDPARVLTCHT